MNLGHCIKIFSPMRKEEGGELLETGDLLRLWKLKHLEPILDDLGVVISQDLEFIFVEDLLEYEVNYDEAVQ